MAAREQFALKREIGWLGSFAMGYADVGADVYIALGLVAAYAAGGMPSAFLIAALIYLCVGLVYAELAPTYPYAGGAHVYSIKAFNDFVGFVAGWAVMLSYTIDITLFSIAAAGYLSFVYPFGQGATIVIPLTGIVLPRLGVLAAFLVVLLMALNYFGIRYSSGFNTGLAVFGVFVILVILLLGFVLAFEPSKFLSQLGTVGAPSPQQEVSYITGFDVGSQNMFYGVTLAMASFIGIESIAQASEETKRPAKWIPRATKLSIFFVLVSVIGFSVLSQGMVSWEDLATHQENPIAFLAGRIPIVGTWLVLPVAIGGFVLMFASANTGVIGVSRLANSMGKFALMPSWFYKIHPRFRTPTRTIVVFGTLGLILSFTGSLTLIADLYTFSALLSYVLVMMAFIRLRNSEASAYRPFLVPGSLKLRVRGSRIEIPVVGLVGLVGTAVLWILVLLLHPLGRIFGTVWLALGISLFIVYRRLSGRRLLDESNRTAIVPTGYYVRTAILVRPFEEEGSVIAAVKHNLDQRFKLFLVTVLEPRKILLDPEKLADSKQLEELRRKTHQDLERIASSLRSFHYAVDTRVYVGDISDIISRELLAGRIDSFALIRRRTEKADIERAPQDSLRRLITTQPGEFIVLRRPD